MCQFKPVANLLPYPVCQLQDNRHYMMLPCIHYAIWQQEKAMPTCMLGNEHMGSRRMTVPMNNTNNSQDNQPQYTPGQPLWLFQGFRSDPVKATFVRYNKKTVTITIHRTYAEDINKTVDISDISPRTPENGGVA
jgi:hypothetical protein